MTPWIARAQDNQDRVLRYALRSGRRRAAGAGWPLAGKLVELVELSTSKVPYRVHTMVFRDGVIDRPDRLA